ncbi:hypothetical protein TNCV_4162761 [Trichonephila clavipes]|nr:hypothetical protein TNCV_4162761 [Trichonephila clavipes]
MANVLSGPESNRACLGHTRTTHCCATKAACYCPRLEIALLEEWNSIPQSLIDNLIASMENRCAAVLAVRGDHTPLLKLMHHA